MSGVKHKTKRILRETGAWLLIAAGLAGCVLPVIPGIPLLIAGLALLAPDYPWAARLLHKAKEKWEHLRGGKKPAM